jgi:hypothetical protein
MNCNLEVKKRIANEMQDSGFKTRITKQGIEISLSNRKVDNMEVQYALEQKFEDIRFELKNTNNGILICS